MGHLAFGGVPCGRDYEEDGDLIGIVGMIGPYIAYDPEDWRAPVKEKRPPGFVRPDEYVKGGVVKTRKSKKKKRS